MQRPLYICFPQTIVDGESQETYTQETFHSLCLKHRKKRKDFLLAAVTTGVENGCFVYAAYPLNRSIFHWVPGIRGGHYCRIYNALNVAIKANL